MRVEIKNKKIDRECILEYIEIEERIVTISLMNKN